jgi:hypothetical protein
MTLEYTLTDADADIHAYRVYESHQRFGVVEVANAVLYASIVSMLTCGLWGGDSIPCRIPRSVSGSSARSWT